MWVARTAWHSISLLLFQLLAKIGDDLRADREHEADELAYEEEKKTIEALEVLEKERAAEFEQKRKTVDDKSVLNLVASKLKLYPQSVDTRTCLPLFPMFKVCPEG